MTHLRTYRYAAVILAVALTIALAIGTPKPVSARTFDFDPNGTMVLQPLPPLWACAMRRAMINRRIPCRGVYGPQGHTIRRNAIASPPSRM